MNKCEELKIVHAWIPQEGIMGFQVVHSQHCGNCGLKRTKHYQAKEWWSYSDGRPDEDATEIRPV